MEFLRTLKRTFSPLPTTEENPTSQQTPSESLASSITATGSHNLAAGRDIHNPNISTLQVTGMSSEQVNANTINVVVNTPGEKPKEVNKFRIIDVPTPNFVGRKEMIEKIHSFLLSCSTNTQLWERTIIIHGLGGMGKTELVRKYVQLHINDPIIQNVAWIDSETKTSLEKSFKNIARILRLNMEGLDVDEIAVSVYQHFSENFEAGMFIFDNAVQLQENEHNFGIYKYLPIQQLERLPLILITSRTNEWEAISNTLDISELSEDESVQLLKAKLKLNAIQKKDSKIHAAILNLAQVIQGYPLGLTLAAANINYSKFVNIANEIQNYIKRLDMPKSGWIDDKHSDGSASKYTLVMNNVWQVTFDKMKSMGVKGECALTLLNIMAFLPTDYTEKSLVDQILEFGYSNSFSTDVMNDGYRCLEMFSLINLLETETTETDGMDFLIQIHRHVQRCTRERLDSVGDYSYLLGIARYLCELDKFDQVECIKIHRHLKIRKWPQDALRYSIIFLSRYYNNDEFADELVTHLSEATQATANNNSDALAKGYMTLLGLSLYLFSEKNIFDDDDEARGAANLRKQWREKYTEAFNASMEILANALTNEESFPVRDTCTEVQQRVTDVFEDILDAKNQFKRICIKNPDSRSKNVGQAVTRIQHSQIISKINEALNIYDPNYLDQNAILGFKVALKLYLLIYSSSSLSHELPARGPIDYNRLQNALKESKEKRTNSAFASKWEKSIIDAILNHGGLQVVQYDFSYRVDSEYLQEVVGFSFNLIAKYHCSEAFKRTPYFLETLKEQIVFAHEDLKECYLLLWLALFPPNCTFQDTERRKFINSLADTMKPLVNYTKNFKMFSHNILKIYEDEVVRALRPHLELSKSDSLEDLGFKNAVAVMMENVTERSGWVDSLMQATFDKIGSMGVKGKCALTMLKILTFLPARILKSRVDGLLDFGDSPIKDYVVEGYNILKTPSLIKEQSKNEDFEICVYRPAQLCIRERLYCVDDHCVLLSIRRFLRQINSKDIPNVETSLESIHNYLKQRKWPKESLRFSITIMSWYCRDAQIYSKFALELAKDLSEVIEADDQDYFFSLRGGYETLLGMLLYIASEIITYKNDHVTASLLRRWNKKYEEAFDASLKIFASALFLEDSLLPINKEVQQLITDSMEHFVQNYCTPKRIRIKIRDSVVKAVEETTTAPQHSLKLSLIYSILDFYDTDESNLNCVIALKSALQLHFELFTNNISLLDREYWNRYPISYPKLKLALNECKRKRTDPSIATDWEKSIVGAFLAHGGPQAAQQSLSFIDDWFDLNYVIAFVNFFVTEYNCTKAFKETPSFLHSLLGKTAASREGGKHRYLLLWLALFSPNNSFQDNEGRKWSLNSVADQMNEFLADYLKRTESNRRLYFNLDEDVLIKTLLPHLDLSESKEQQELHFKTAVALMNGDIAFRTPRNISRSRGWEAVFKTHFITRHNTQPEILEIRKKHFSYVLP